MNAEPVEVVKTVTDWAAASVMIGAVLSWLPNIAALFTIIWTGLRIFDWFYKKSKT